MNLPPLNSEPSNNDLAQERTEWAKYRSRAAADRTLMAWIRTSLSLIGFGFGIPTKDKVKATEEIKPQIVSNSTQTANSSNTITQQRSTRNSPEAEGAIASAIDAIIHHNNTTELHDLKWAISINAVKELVSDVTKSQRLVDKAIKERHNEIDAHHAQHQLEPSHNHRHKRKRTIRESIPFPWKNVGQSRTALLG